MVRTEKQLKGLLLTCILVLIVAPPAVAASNVMHIADDIMAAKGNNVTVPIMVHNATGTGCAGINLRYDASVVNVTNAEQGDFTDHFGFDNSNAADGWVTINTYRIGDGLTGDVTFAYVTLEAVGDPDEQSSLNLGILSLTYPNGTEAPRSTDNGTFVVSDVTAPSVTDPLASPPVISNDGATTTRLSVKVTDDGDIAGVTIDLSAIGGSSTQTMSITGDEWECITSASASHGIYDLRVNATDSWGNSNTSVTIPLKVVKPATVYIGDPSVLIGESVTTPIMIYNATDTASIGVKLRYNASVITVTGAGQGDFTDYFGFDSRNAADGWVTINTYITGTQLTGDLIVATGEDTSPLNLEIISMTDKDGYEMPGTTRNGTFTTIIDTGPPAVTDPSASHPIPDDTDNDPRWGEIVQLNVTVTDDRGVAGVTIDLSAIGGSSAQPMNHIGGNIWSVTTNASAGTPPQTYNLCVTAIDIYGKSNNSVSIPLTVMRNGDTTGNGVVTIADAMLLANHVSYPGRYSISSEFVADVSGDGGVNIADAMLLANHVSYPGRYALR
jgi:hypothetical protein